MYTGHPWDPLANFVSMMPRDGPTRILHSLISRVASSNTNTRKPTGKLRQAIKTFLANLLKAIDAGGVWRSSDHMQLTVFHRHYGQY